MEPRVTYVKAFTQDPERGNPAVVIEAPLDALEVREIAQRARCSTAAVIDRSQPAVIPITFWYWYGDIESNACGHATLAAAQVVCSEEMPLAIFVNKKGERIQVARSPDGSISQAQPMPMVHKAHCNTAAVCDALGIRKKELVSHIPIALAGIPGKMKVLVPLQFDALMHLAPDFETTNNFCRTYSPRTEKITGLLPYAFTNSGIDAHARHFPSSSTEEDPVCGVGGLALARYMSERERNARTRFRIRCGPGEQGAGDMTVTLSDPRAMPSAHLSGYAVIVP